MTDAQSQAQREFALQRIYTKDVSFETPNTPEIFRGEWTPETNLNLGTRATSLSEGVFEVVLTITVTTKVGDKTAYLVEVNQAGIFGIRGFPDAELAHMLAAYCPGVLFPYAREVISDLVVKGSFPQMLLAPVNFDLLYAQHQMQQAEQNQPGAAMPASDTAS